MVGRQQGRQQGRHRPGQGALWSLPTAAAQPAAGCAHPGGGTMAGKTTGSFWKSTAALESLTFCEVTSKGASHVKEPVLSLDPGLSFLGKNKGHRP